MELPKIDLGKYNLTQLGYVYKDIEKQAKKKLDLQFNMTSFL